MAYYGMIREDLTEATILAGGLDPGSIFVASDTGSRYFVDSTGNADIKIGAADMLLLDSRVIVNQDNHAAILGGTIDSTKVYVVDGVIDLGTTEITVPAAGMFIQGVDYFISGLTSTEANHTMFKTGAGSYAGNFRMNNMFLTSSGTGSKIFNLDNAENFGAIEFNSCNLGDFSDDTTSLGELISYRQFRTNDCGFFRNQDGLTFSGTWAGGFRISDTIVLSQAAGSILFKVGTSLTFGGRCISDINASSVDPTTITFDFVPANFLLDGGFQLTGAAFAPNSSISVTTDETSIKSFFRDCVEIKNTRPGFELTWTAEVENTITQDVITQGLGTTVTGNNTWFTQTGNNSVTYDSSLSKDFLITAPITIKGGANDALTMTIRRWDDSLSSYEDVKSISQPVNNLVGADDLVYFNMTARVEDLSINDRIEIWITNTTDATNITFRNGSEIICQVI